MLVIISDIHLTDGSSGATISPAAFHLLAERVEDMAQRASYRVGGSYRPIEQIDLVLLGDVIDVIRSDRWLGGTARPWDDPSSAALVQTLDTITGDALAKNDSGLAVLRSMSTGGAIRVPASERASRLTVKTDGQPVPVRIHYMVGNHDWFFHLPGTPFDRLRQRLIEAMGLANRVDEPFPHDPQESGELLEALRRHKVFARHGDIYDPINFEGDRDRSSLGDAIVIELLNRFSVEVSRQLGDELPAATVAGLREIDNVRPRLLVPVWIDGLLERTCPRQALRTRIKQIWDAIADDFLELAFVRSRDSWHPNDIVDGLQRALKFSQRLSFGWASSIAGWLHELRGASESSYYQHALAEQDFRNRRAQHIVYGHTHDAETVPLDASYSEGFVLNQMYFNSGTWRRVHRPARHAPQQHEFIAHEAMTYLVFYQADERRGRPYETWTGSLGVGETRSINYRLDAGVKRHASGQPVSSSTILQRGPHFAPSSAPPAIVPTRRQ